MGRIPSLDGIRALSIILVIIGHQYQSLYHRNPATPVWIIAGNGSLGVEIFFVISGYLITSLLLREDDKYGRISLWNFYVRRVFRIFPALYAYVGVVCVANTLFHLNVSRSDFLSALAFVWDYSPWAHSWTLAHTWSLSIEEQFYLLWPSALVIILARRSRRVATWTAFALIVAAPILRVLTSISGSEFLSHRIYFTLHTRIDSLMVGCIIALLSGTQMIERIYETSRPYVPFLAVYCLVVSPLLTVRFGGAYIYAVGLSAEGICIALLMLWLVRRPESVAGRFFNLRPVIHVGVISYSLYLWQELFLHAENHGLLGSFPLSIACTIFAAELSYRAIERPFLRLRERFEVKRNPLTVQCRIASPLSRSAATQG